jgi:hypothetical protein
MIPMQLTPSQVAGASWYWYTYYDRMGAEVTLDGQVIHLSAPLTHGTVTITEVNGKRIVPVDTNVVVERFTRGAGPAQPAGGGYEFVPYDAVTA